MSAIFISHSSKDNPWAERIAAWLREQGHQSLFLDFDPQNGIPAGRDWEKELQHQLRRCRAVIALLSEHFVASEWCKGEAWIASHLGKSLFPVKVGTCVLPQMLSRHQAVDLTADLDAGLRRLAHGLVVAGLDSSNIFTWDSSRPPYPGLMAFQEADEPVFFGREREIQEGLDRLHNLRRYGGKGLLLLLGASGCGKSSLVRAGIVPRLRRDRENWLVLDPFRPGDNPLAEFADALAKAFRAVGETAPASAPSLLNLRHHLDILRRSSGYRDASAVVVIDQFEELLCGSGSGSDSARGMPAGGLSATQAESFLAELGQISRDGDGRLLVLATLRSDFLGTFQCHPSMVGIPFGDLKLGPMESSAYAQVIAGPADVAGVQLESGLTDRMVSDTSTGDALPLLAFTLRELWERYGKDGDLTLLEYERLGGLEGSVQRAADGLIAAWPMRPDEEAALRRALLQMCRINEEGQLARVVARWDGMPIASREILQRFVKARLLISGKDTGTIEVAHEALLRTWPLLNGWLKASRELLLWRSRVQGALAEYERSGTLLSGKPLEEAERWRLETAEDSVERRLINDSISARARRRRRTTFVFAVAGLSFVGFTATIWEQLQDIRQWQTEVFAEAHQRTIDTDPLESVVNGLATMAGSLNTDPGRSLQLSASLPRAIANNIAVSRKLIRTNQGRVWSLIELRNGELISGGSDGTLRRWRDDLPVGNRIETGQGRVLSLIELKNGELISGGEDGTLRRWRDGQPVGPPIHTGQGMVWSLVELRSGEWISGGANGTLRRWRDGEPVGTTIATNQGGVYGLVELKNGDLISGGENGTLRRWRDGGPVGAPMATNQGGVYSLAELRNGDLISGGEDGLRRWRQGMPLGEPIKTGQGRVLGLTELPNGDLISGGDNGTLRRWRNGKPMGEPINTDQNQVSKLMQLRNGELISAGDNGTLRRWREGQQVGDVIATGQVGVYSLSELQNGEVISGGENGTLRRWRDGKPVGDVIETGQGSVLNLIELKNGELISGGEDGSLRRWREATPVGAPINTEQGEVNSLIELKNGELISGGKNGTLRRWRGSNAVGEPINTGQGIVLSLIQLRNGELFSGGGNGSLRRWRDGKSVGDVIQTGQGSVFSLIELKNGELISGGDNGTLRRWRDGKPVGEPIDTGQGLAWKLISLRNGELISGVHDGTLIWLSPYRASQIACQHELPELMRAPETMSDKEASSLCMKMGFFR
jgi:WD40 repeat protein